MPRTIELEEHIPARVAPALLSEAEGAALLRVFGEKFDVQFPSVRTGGFWILTSKGYVGIVTISHDLTVVIRPKLPVANIGRMLQYAYDLPVQVLPGLATCRAVPDVFEQLIRALLDRVQRILRQGIHHRYVRAERFLGAVRGRVLAEAQLRRPARLELPCAFEERTPDVLENRVLLWTLDRALRAGVADDRLQGDIRRARLELLSRVALVRVGVEQLDAITYDRLTQRYRDAHVICRLLLEGAGPGTEQGGARTPPFLLDMPRLFERFVARWLAEHLPPGISLRAQERHSVGDHPRVDFSIDLVLQTAGGSPVCVLDTKYKLHRVPAADDVAQIGFYALLEGCRLAGLVYPQPVSREWCGVAGGVEAFRTTFDLGGDIEAAGERFMTALLLRLDSGATQGAESWPRSAGDS